MSDAGSRSMSRRDHRATKQGRPPRPTVLGVIGALLITAVLLILVFVVWELSKTAPGATREAQAHRDTMSEMFDTQYEAGFNGNGPDPSVPEHADDAWRLLYVPRFGAYYSV